MGHRAHPKLCRHGDRQERGCAHPRQGHVQGTATSGDVMQNRALALFLNIFNDNKNNMHISPYNRYFTNCRSTFLNDPTFLGPSSAESVGYVGAGALLSPASHPTRPRREARPSPLAPQRTTVPEATACTLGCKAWTPCSPYTAEGDLVQKGVDVRSEHVKQTVVLLHIHKGCLQVFPLLHKHKGKKPI